MGNSIGAVFLLVVFILIVVAFMRFNNTSGKDMISDALREKGAKPTLISREWVDADRNTMSYLVEYIDSNGNKFSSRCKIRHTGLFLDKKIYWSDMVALGTATDALATIHGEKQAKKNPSLSELHSKNTKSKKQYKATKKTRVINKVKSDK